MILLGSGTWFLQTTRCGQRQSLHPSNALGAYRKSLIAAMRHPLLLFQPEYLYCGNQMDGGKVGGNSGCDSGSSRYAFNDVIVDVQNAVGTGYSCARGW